MSADALQRVATALSPARRWRVLLAGALVLLAAAFATASILRLLPEPTSRPFVSGSGLNAEGSAQALVDGQGRKAVWTAGGDRTVVPRLVLTWPTSSPIGSLAVRSASGGGLDAIYLRFGNGSRLRAEADRSGDVRVAFDRRSTSTVEVVLIAKSTTSRISLASVTTGTEGISPAATGDVVAERSFGTTASRTLSWASATEVSSVRLRAASASTTPVEGFLRFSDGSRVRVANAGLQAGRPNVVAFTPRVVDAVSYTGSGRAQVAGLAAYREGVPVEASQDEQQGYVADSTEVGSCTQPAGPSSSLQVLCPSASTVVGPRFMLRVTGPVGSRVTVDAWRRGGNGDGGVETVAAAVVPAAGWRDLSIDTRSMYSGPTALRVSNSTETTYLQVVNRVGVAPPERSPTFTAAMSAQVDERFDGPVSISLDGSQAQYAALKPSARGPSPFGSAAFGDPTSDPAPFATERGALRIQAITTQDANDALAYRSGLLSSVGSSGGGFSAQYGYFEATVMGAPGQGAWSAFWTQGIGSVLGTGAPFGEADATELYGGQYGRTCSGVLDWMPQSELPSGLCAEPSTMDDWALEYHTYGIEIRPDATDAYVDGRVVARFRPEVLAEDPSFFMLNLALGGGYDVDLRGQQGVTRLFAAGIRVWT